MIEPPPTRRMRGSACFKVRKVPVTLTAKIRFHSSSEVCSTVFSISMPAALTSTSSRPCSRSTRAMRSTALSSLVTSWRWKTTTPGAAAASASAAAAGSGCLHRLPDMLS